MLFAIHALDRPDALPARMAAYDAHRAYLPMASTYGVTIVMSGPLIGDDGHTPIGSLFILEAPDRAAVENFHRHDPFFTAAVWGKIAIHLFHKKHG